MQVEVLVGAVGKLHLNGFRVYGFHARSFAVLCHFRTPVHSTRTGRGAGGGVPS